MSAERVSPDDIARAATQACLMEVSAPKVGNVHRGADFEDLTFYDFVLAAAAIAKPISSARQTGVGAAALEAIQATRQCVSSNVNLGIVLLLAPMAAADPLRPLDEESLGEVLRALTPADAQAVYQAIRTADPGGLGKAEAMDVADAPPANLLEAMAAAQERDMIAAQYVSDFAYVTGGLADRLLANCRRWGWPRGIVHTQLHELAAHHDTLILRKCGEQVAETARLRAAAVLDCGPPDRDEYHEATADLDFWLRSDGHRRNPGAIADLLAGSLFVLLRDGRMTWRGD